MTLSSLSNQQLLDELASRLGHVNLSNRSADVLKLENEIRELSARLQESERGKSQFLSNIRNEINNPLASIIGLAASIQGMTSERKIQQMSSLIHNQAWDLDFQMRNIMVAAEIQMGEVNLSISRVDIVSLIENTVKQLEYRSVQKNVTVQLELPDHLKFRTDAHIVQTICLNVIANAIEYCGLNKLVVVEGADTNGFLEIVVRDFGPGIDPELRKQIFQRFKQGESGLTKRHGGHGLGMSIVGELLVHLGGTIEIESDSRSGTTVKVRIPETISTSGELDSSSFGNELMFTADEQF